MNILAHRGYWNRVEERNSLKALKEAFKNGYGIETDIRDYKGSLVISHDVADENCPFLKDVLECYSCYPEVFLAINIKADGLQKRLSELLDKYHVTNYAVFDMSIPEQVVYRRDGISYLTRQSDFEETPVLYVEAFGVWLDEWDDAWITQDVIDTHLASGKKVFVVSPELHGKPYNERWELLKKYTGNDRVYLCTDIPDEAERYFS